MQGLNAARSFGTPHCSQPPRLAPLVAQSIAETSVKRRFGKPIARLPENPQFGSPGAHTPSAGAAARDSECPCRYSDWSDQLVTSADLPPLLRRGGKRLETSLARMVLPLARPP